MSTTNKDTEASDNASTRSNLDVIDEPVDQADEQNFDPELVSYIQREARTQAVAVVRHESHSGPMPSPRQLAMYDAVLPGTAQVIRDEFQANGAHVRRMENRALEAHKNDNDRNRKAAEKLIWGAFALIFALAWLGYEKAAIAVAISVVSAVVAGFLNKLHKSKTQEASISDDSRSSPDD